MPKFTNHAEMVKTLAKPGEDIIKSLTPLKAHLWHMASCIMGEVAELYEARQNEDRNNIVEELGDIEFFLEGIRFALHVSREETLNSEAEFPNQDIIKSAELFDVIKKHVIYNKEIDMKKLIKSLSNFEATLREFRIENDITYEETLQGNLDKLNVRYADGYSDQAAQHRADKQQTLQEAVNKATAD